MFLFDQFDLIVNFLSNIDLMIDTELHWLGQVLMYIYAYNFNANTSQCFCVYMNFVGSVVDNDVSGDRLFVVILRTSFCSDAHGELICWTLTLMRTLLHLCVIVMDYDNADCYISYLSMFVFLFMYI